MNISHEVFIVVRRVLGEHMSNDESSEYSKQFSSVACDVVWMPVY